MLTTVELIAAIGTVRDAIAMQLGCNAIARVAAADWAISLSIIDDDGDNVCVCVGDCVCMSVYMEIYRIVDQIRVDDDG